MSEGEEERQQNVSKAWEGKRQAFGKVDEVKRDFLTKRYDN